VPAAERRTRGATETFLVTKESVSAVVAGMMVVEGGLRGEERRGEERTSEKIVDSRLL
jgi:hypothetical protein